MENPDLMARGVLLTARAAWAGFIQAARTIARDGSFADFEGLAPFAELNASFREDSKRRPL